jgi:alpha-glucosidase
MRNVFIVSVILLFNLDTLFAANAVTIKSPSEKLTVKITESKTDLKLSLFSLNVLLLEADVGIFVFDKDSIRMSYAIGNVMQTSKDEEWKPVYGERSAVRDRYNEIDISFMNKGNTKKALNLLCRIYDEGIAFRYLFPKDTETHLLKKELTAFNFDNDYDAWVANRAQSEYRKGTIGEIDVPCERPLVIKRTDTSYLALGEAALVNFARMKFKRDPQKAYSLQTDLAGDVNLEKAGYMSPWRYVMVADAPGQLLENNYFIENLNESNKLEDISWIKPGKVIREVTLTTRGGIACIDFAARHNLQYVEFDAGWYGNEYDEKSDASTITVDPRRSPGPLDLHQVIDYANRKGIGIILYVNRRALEKQLDELLPLYKTWGIKGLKYGFVNVGPQEWTSWLHDAVRKAATYHMMVDIHDEYRPTGYSRTYPNLMTQEGIRGDEESPSVEHTLITLFTRMIAGAGDNTNCYQASRVSEKMGGKAAQMAKAVMLYSPWQFLFWYDRPEGSPQKKGGAGSSEGIIRENSELAFYAALPTVWDETKVLEGKIGEYATIARKNGTDWFIGSLAANHDRRVEIPLDFLEEGNTYEAVIFAQDARNLEDNEIKITRNSVSCETILSKKIVKNSGLAVIIKKLRND